MQYTTSYMQLTNSNAIVKDDENDVENQQQFNKAMHTIKRMNLPASSKV